MRRIFLLGLGCLALIGLGFALSQYMAPDATASAAQPQILGSVPDDVPSPPQADERTKEMRRFDRYDADGDGRIARMEFLASRQKAFARLDLDHNGGLSFAEYAAKATDKYLKADKDKSQSLDRAEFAATKPVRKARPTAKCPPGDQPASAALVDAAEG